MYIHVPGCVYCYIYKTYIAFIEHSNSSSMLGKATLMPDPEINALLLKNLHV